MENLWLIFSRYGKLKLELYFALLWLVFVCCVILRITSLLQIHVSHCSLWLLLRLVHKFTCLISFLSPNQHCQSIKGNSLTSTGESHLLSSFCRDPPADSRHRILYTGCLTPVLCVHRKYIHYMSALQFCLTHTYNSNLTISILFRVN